MRLRLRHGEHARDVVVTDIGSATLGDLAVSAGFPAPSIASIGAGDPSPEALLPASTPLRSLPLCNGTVLRFDPIATATSAAAGFGVGQEKVASIGQVAGWSAGGSVDVPAGDYGLGNGALPHLSHGMVDDPTFFVRVTATGTQVHPGANRFVTVDDADAVDVPNARERVIATGDSAFAVRGPASTTRQPGPVLWNRPPRVAVPEEDLTIDLPSRPQNASARQALSWAMMIAPIPIGLVMAIYWSPIFALFILMSPVMMIARWFESGRTSKKDRRRFGLELNDALDTVSARLAAVKQRETARRRFAQPDIAQLSQRAACGDQQLWQRRRSHDDFLCLAAGVADEYVRLEADPAQLSAFPEAAALVSRPLRLPQVPALAELTTDGSIGLAGPRDQVIALARSLLLQAVTLHGPADLDVGIVARSDRLPTWDFAKWLPHLTTSGGVVRVATQPDELPLVLPDSAGDLSRPRTLLVVDHTDLLTSRGSPLRAALLDDDRPLHAIVIAERVEQLPAACGVLVEVDRRSDVVVRYPRIGKQLRNVRPSAVSVELAVEWSQSLAGFIDPEADGASAGIESSISLLDLLPGFEPAAIVERWATAGTDPAPRGPIGVTGLGPMTVDLATDGPHGLVAGTTGAGKSELLRSMVASMCSEVGPQHLNFVLIDFKGGGAFDVCAELPHVVSVVTDLDEHLAERALRCLKAELRLREERLRAAGATDLPEYLQGGGQLPRLVVIIDEFATLAVELPTFLDSLVDIAQRGRSLGVHMILATQRPSGVLDKKVKANTNLRIALRVQDDNDSEDVIGTAQASKLTRHQPGRAFARRGQTDIVEFQTALATKPHTGGVEQQLQIAPFSIMSPLDVADAAADNADAPAPPQPVAVVAPSAPDVTDLAVLVNAINQAFVQSGLPTPRVPWPDPLPGHIDATNLQPQPDDQAAEFHAPYAIVDLPDRQSQVVQSWTPAVGTMALYGIDDKPITDTMITIACGLASRNGPDRVHLYGIEHGPKRLASLARLPHTGSVIDGSDLERTRRLIALLAGEIQARRSRPAGVDVTTLLLIDSWSAIAENLEEARDHETVAHLVQIIREGPRVGVYCLIGCSHERALPTRVASLIPSKLLFRLVDANAYMLFGLGLNQVPTLGVGRAIDGVSFEQLQVATYPDHAVAALTGRGASMQAMTSGRGPAEVEVLDTHVNLAAVDQLNAEMSPDAWQLPIGIDGATLDTAYLHLSAGEHALVLGAAGSGKSSTLATIAAAARLCDPGVPIIAVAHRRSPLRHSTAVTALVGAETDPDRLRELVDVDRVLVLVDDCDSTPDAQAAVLADVATAHRDQRHVVAACRTDFPKAFDSWVGPLRRFKNGALLQPSPGDGDSLRTQIPLMRPERFPPGRGFLIAAGLPAIGQIALPPSITLGEQRIVDTTKPRTTAAVASVATTYQTETATPDQARGTHSIDLGLDDFSTSPQEPVDASTSSDQANVIDLGLGDFSTTPTPERGQDNPDAQ